MGPVVQEHLLLAVNWIEECHYIGTILHGTGSPFVHATIKEGVGNLIELSVQRHFSDEWKVATRIVA